MTKYLLGCEECQKRSETDCDAKKNTKKQNLNQKNIINLNPIDYSKVTITPEKKVLKPKNLFVDPQSKVDSCNRNTNNRLPNELETNSSTAISLEKNNSNFIRHDVSSNNDNSKLTVRPIEEINNPDKILGQDEPLNLHYQEHYSINTGYYNIQKSCLTSTLTPHYSTDSILPHSPLDPEQTENPETPKRPIDLCIKRPDNKTYQTNLTNTVVLDTPSTTSNFRKRKQSSNLIFRYTTSTPETPSKSKLLKKESLNSSGSNTTISRSSDSACESCLDVSPIEKDGKVHNPIMQITTTDRKINIPLKVPHYETPYCNRLGGNISFNDGSVRQPVQSDLASHVANSTIATGAIKVPSLQLLSSNPPSRTEQVRKIIVYHCKFFLPSVFSFF